MLSGQNPEPTTEGDLGLDLHFLLGRREKCRWLKVKLSLLQALPCGCKPQADGDLFNFVDGAWVHAESGFARDVIRVPAGGCGKPLFPTTPVFPVPVRDQEYL